MWQEELQGALEVLKNGGLILYPTDTIWGIGCDATRPECVEKIFALKQRQEEKSLVVLLDADVKLNRYLKEVPDLAWDLVEMATSPLTIVYPEARGLATNAIATDGSVAIRITDDPFCKELIRRFNRPLISTSANLSGKPSPRFFAEIETAILNGVDYVVNLRQDEKSPAQPSSIIKLGLHGEISIIRK